MTTLTQSQKRQTRKEIEQNIAIAVQQGDTAGSVVTAHGHFLRFRVERIGRSIFIHIGGHVLLNAKDAAGAAMLTLGYTRY